MVHASMWGSVFIVCHSQVFKWWVPGPMMEEITLLTKGAVVSGGASVQSALTCLLAAGQHDDGLSPQHGGRAAHG